MVRTLSAVVLCLTLFKSAIAAYTQASYSLVKDYQAGTSSFFNNFNYYSGADPSNGFVKYLSQSAAVNAGLTWNWNGASYILADSWNKAPNGRASVRLESKDTFNEVLIIANFNHVPGAACGVWPAFWTSNLANWPNSGEIDILEGVNNQNVNKFTLHSGDNCSVSGQVQTGYESTTDCAESTSSSGCGGWAASTSTYGDGMNAVGGGVYAMDWRQQGIRIWSFPQNSIPSDITSGKPNPSNWGTPQGDFPNTACNIHQHFSNHQIVFDITFCGDWAGNVYTPWGCPGTCQNQVANNPSSFSSAYFGVKSLKVYKATTTV